MRFQLIDWLLKKEELYKFNNIFTLFLAMFIMSLCYQLFKFKRNKSQTYLNLFKLNNYSGLLLFVGIYSISL